MTALDALEHVVMLLGSHGVDDVNAGLVDGKQVGRGKNANVWSHYRLCLKALAVTGYRHVAHHVNIGHMLAEIVDGRLGRFGHALHKFLFLDIPLVILTRCGVDPRLADAAVGTPDADVLV